jgi:hypothetical protein
MLKMHDQIADLTTSDTIDSPHNCILYTPLK